MLASLHGLMMSSSALRKQADPGPLPAVRRSLVLSGLHGRLATTRLNYAGNTGTGRQNVAATCETFVLIFLDQKAVYKNKSLQATVLLISTILYLISTYI